MKKIKNKEDLNKFVDKIKSQDGYKEPIAWAVARVEKSFLDEEKTLCANYAVINYKENYASFAVLFWALQECGIKVDTKGSEFVAKLDRDVVDKVLEIFDFLVDEVDGNSHKNLQNFMTIDEILSEDGEDNFCATFIFEDKAPKSVESVYLKLYLLSLGKVALRSLNLDGAFGVLPNVAWDLQSKPIELEWLKENEIWLKMSGAYPTILSVDKFPRFLSHIVPNDSVRVLDSSKVRLGAHLADGTTIMPGASYVNFNAGTTGKAMVEGRISSSVIVGDGSDIGGGASILGVLSGTSGNAISVGKRALLGANSVTGIPLGDDCIVDAGIAILEGTKIYISSVEAKKLQEANKEFKFDKEIFKGLELCNLNSLHFRQDSQSGKITASYNKKTVKLNENLH
ncbi:tetrahydrodipicolinate N-succinyltransferase N-terminal domain-containing protein [Campylobacter geochelonis]|uniref:2,3,4,5-tetrahydropyridine-2,6-carboxyla te N-succinyltransferase n=1 Tax=Campylobacter geochelonis TaxID=1780362 RepID=A0A128ER73_9BACT|nr:tetrahydrodipicolinate N-succinyltransferase N-terminal domain-containing protein [Campylobacter geochelonis]QKF71744.1 tetrahydrodipicolinate succinylase [Campylobacter geochelonis]CZE47607.1 2%2C3%2C4%2C5-tetrahydropyridine-2%2C6-carboxyla te N-succinyltransferase [Campylobacter geochelonis]CZE48529.1 2%2C3%2C4%2C5-tetrahydropyridine-2%2C6-carboxyla te N-succinyltransferase [Campylobacter geochelonis]CZE51163.1 2%2C3%2C4%2C5-tetrahydropyridine-2%2C6-carboxyla te N-succinyltransferase [Camp